MAVDIKLSELEAILAALVHQLFVEFPDGVVSISDENDYYWHVPMDELNRMDSQPQKLDVGRLSDDWEFLRPLLKNKGQVFPLMMIHLAPILRHVAEIKVR